MRKRVCSQAKSSWNAEILIVPAKPLRGSLYFMTIRPSLRGRWTRQRWLIDKQAMSRKQTGCRTSCTNDIRITSADKQQWTALGNRHFLGTIVIPHGPSPALTRPSSLRDFTSTTETSFDAPFAV